MAMNFYIYVDKGGKMPQLRRRPTEIKTHPYYIKYGGDKPIAIHGPRELLTTDGKVYDYALKEFVPADGIPSE